MANFNRAQNTMFRQVEKKYLLQIPSVSEIYTIPLHNEVI